MRTPVLLKLLILAGDVILSVRDVLLDLIEELVPCFMYLSLPQRESKSVCQRLSLGSTGTILGRGGFSCIQIKICARNCADSAFSVARSIPLVADMYLCDISTEGTY